MLSRNQIAAAAQSVGLEPAAVQAVLSVESNGQGFWTIGGRKVPVVNFEGQWFHKLTGGRFHVSHPDLSLSTGMDRKFGQGEWQRYANAAQLDEDAAMKSTSWGLFQVMGFNHHMCGFPTVQDFVRAMSASEDDQLRAFLAFIQAKGLLPTLKGHDWKTFAWLYNGPNYAVNNYDVRMAQAYEQAKGVPV